MEPSPESTVDETTTAPDWGYVSGFFDGEGGLTINCNSGKRVIHVDMIMSQKSKEVLRRIAEFLWNEGIDSAISRNSDGTHRLRISRIPDMIRLASRMKLIVKARQVQAATAYLEGKLTGNEFLAVLQEEFLSGRRKSRIPERAFRFPLTTLEAKRVGHKNASAAGTSASRSIMHRQAMNAFASLPGTFTSTDLMKCLGVGRMTALDRGRYFEKLGLVTKKRIRRNGGTWVLFSKVEARVSPPLA